MSSEFQKEAGYAISPPNFKLIETNPNIGDGFVIRCDTSDFAVDLHLPSGSKLTISDLDSGELVRVCCCYHGDASNSESFALLKGSYKFVVTALPAEAKVGRLAFESGISNVNPDAEELSFTTTSDTIVVDAVNFSRYTIS